VSESRETPRRTIAAEVQLKRSGSINYVVHAYDLSEQGCRLEFVERPWIGETVWVKFGKLQPIRSTVRWTGDFTAGLEFERAMDPRVLEWLLGQLQ
jgi:hypothetical protein